MIDLEPWNKFKPFNISIHEICKDGIEYSCEIFTGFNQFEVCVGVIGYGGGNATPSWISIRDKMGCCETRVEIEDAKQYCDIDLHNGIRFSFYGDSELGGIVSACRFIANMIERSFGMNTHKSPTTMKYTKKQKLCLR